MKTITVAEKLTLSANSKLTCGRVSRLHGEATDKHRCWLEDPGSENVCLRCSSVTRVEISRLVTSTIRTELRVSAQVHVQEFGHRQELGGGAVLGTLGE